MAIHDAYARFTPYELLLPDADFPDRHFPAIGAEAEERGVDTGNPAAFVMLGTVQGALAELREEDAGAESAHDHGGILFFAYHMWRRGGGVVLAQQKTLRGLLGGSDGSGTVRGKSLWARDLGGSAGYVQLPQHLVWIEEARNGPPESVDGFFWHGDDNGVLHLAMVAGMRKDRPGCVVVAVPPQPLDALPGWASGPAREGGGDFSDFAARGRAGRPRRDPHAGGGLQARGTGTRTDRAGTAGAVAARARCRHRRIRNRLGPPPDRTAVRHPVSPP